MFREYIFTRLKALQHRFSFRRSLKTKLFASFILILLPVLILLILGYRSERERLIDAVLDSQVQTAEAVAALVDAKFDEAISVGWALADEQVVTSMDSKTLDAYLRRLIQQYPQYQAINVSNRDLDNIGTSGVLPPETRRKGLAADLPYILQAIKTGEPVISPVLRGRGPISGIVVVVATVPITNEKGETIGTVSLPLRLDATAENLKEIALGPEQNIVLVDPAGTAAFHTALPSFVWEQRNLSSFGAVQAGLKGRVAKLRQFTSPVLNDSRIGAFVPSPKYGWVVGVTVREDMALAPVKSALRNQLIILVSIALLSFGLILVLSHRLVQPIRKLTGHALSLAAGKLEQPVAVRTGDELEELGRTLNIMAVEIQLREERLREIADIVESSNDAIIGHNLEGIITSWNPAAEHLYGYAAGEAVGNHVSMIIPRDHAEELSELLGRIGREERVERFDTVWVCKDGRRVDVSLTVSPIKNRNGNVIGASVIARDITERIRIEKALRELNETLEQQVAERTSVAETRTRQLQRLAIQLTEAEERERTRIADLLHDDLQQILAGALMQLRVSQQNADSHLQVVGQLLEESIYKSRRLSHELSPAILHHSGLTDSLQWLGQQMKEQHGLDVFLESDQCDTEGEPLKVFLFRSVQELLFNVVKHAGTDEARVNLCCSEEQMSVTVSDAGAGFDPSFLDMAGAVSEGFGLLSIRERARNIGGNLVIESEPGRGSTFTLTVPCTLQPDSDGNEPEEHALPDTAVHPGEHADGFCRVLLADDHKVMLQGLISVLESQPGIQVLGEASTGREAVEMARVLRPDVIVMDISMPGMDGIEATRRIKESVPQIRVVGLSMFEEQSVIDAMRQAGAEAFVKKTDTSNNVLRAIFGPSCRVPAPSGQVPTQVGDAPGPDSAGA